MFIVPVGQFVMHNGIFILCNNSINTYLFLVGSTLILATASAGTATTFWNGLSREALKQSHYNTVAICNGFGVRLFVFRHTLAFIKATTFTRNITIKTCIFI